MPKISCNIDKTDRINRTVIGAMIMLGALLGLGTWFYFLVALILIVEGIIGWCGIPVLMSKIVPSLENKP